MTGDERAARRASTGALAAKARGRKNVGLLPNVGWNLVMNNTKKLRESVSLQ